MKRAVYLLLWLPNVVLGQVVNPTVIHQDTDIALHHTDVYYAPMAPPADTDRRDFLSCISHELRDPDGVRSYVYEPITHGVALKDWNPYGAGALGDTVVWMRLFTAKDKPSGAHSDIMAGDTSGTDTVIVSKNEDVDFRASGTIKFEAGFHAMPGSFVHAYIEPRWDTTVFADEFDDTAKFQNQWVVWDSSGVQKANCSYESNMAFDSDPDANDGRAIRLDFWLDTCQCYGWFGGGAAEDCALSLTHDLQRFYLSTANMQTCPWPFISRGEPLRPAYHNSPYGKYEVREKIPNISHHTNAFCGDQGNEFNLYETYSGDMTVIHPGLSHNILYGPFRGKFSSRILDGSRAAVFQSSNAHFALWNKPEEIIIDNFPYEVRLAFDTSSHPQDTLLLANATTEHEGGFPSSIVADSTNSVNFYYVRGKDQVCISDPLPWTVDPTGRYFNGPYGLARNGDTLYFGRDYQPTKIFLADSNAGPKPVLVEYPCHWDHTTNKVYLADAMGSLSSHNGVGFNYISEEGPSYPVPALPRDTEYTYHTYTMELLPHEALFLVDGYVVRRFPDRLIPVGDIRYDFVTKYSRSPLHIFPAENEMDGDLLDKTIASFQAYGTSLDHGCWDVNGHHAAHHLVDYVKVWDVPQGSSLSTFPQ